MINNWDNLTLHAANTPLLDAEETVQETPAGSGAPASIDPWRNVVYECCDTALWRKRLVLTPYMLLDRLKVCSDLASEAQDKELSTEAHQRKIERVSEELNHLIHLLWRSGLWSDTQTIEQTACDGQTYQVLAAPFTDGKPHGKPLPPDAPSWLREMLGV